MTTWCFRQQPSWRRRAISKTTTIKQLYYSSASSSLSSSVPILEVDADNDDPERLIRQFHHQYYKQQIPVVLKNSVGYYPAISKWKDLNYLVQTVNGASENDVVVHCDVEASNNNNQQQQQQYCYGERMTIPFENYIDYLKLYYEEEEYGNHSSSGNQRNGDEREQPQQPPLLYMAQNELQSFPGLENDIEIPSICTTPVTDGLLGHVYHTMLWIGPRGCVSPLHYDPLDNLLMQLVGTKRIALISKSINPNWLYAGGVGENGGEEEGQYNTSPVNVEDPDLNKFPLYEQVLLLRKQQQQQMKGKEEQQIMMDVELVPGDALYIPSKWWHHVRSLDLTISVNVWFR